MCTPTTGLQLCKCRHSGLIQIPSEPTFLSFAAHSASRTGTGKLSFQSEPFSQGCPLSICIRSKGSTASNQRLTHWNGTSPY
ncbi:hypothetical protein CEXT_249451 [Caerostris extrusa]|uniref:Uncharacterized protein n=1 Tax=Caerostris extrusa TaxID=172846 RepID=A0AAV4MUJ3_CAEEX|nr:hypothetical protein CEXT_249451 [Caerostris extrusa]